MSAQSLAEYQWENRLVVIHTATENSELLRKQMQVFENKQKEFIDRKLKVIHTVPGKMKITFPETSAWKAAAIYSEMKKNKPAFELLLIGLDGGVKLRQQDILQTEKLFSLIDGMPMRRAEMQRKDQ